MSDYDEVQKLKADIVGLKKMLIEATDKFARMERTYNDLLYNLDDDNLGTTLKAEKDGMKASIKVTADEIESEVSRAGGAEGDLSSRITQTAEDITARVSKTANYSTATRAAGSPGAGVDKTKLYFNTTNNIYYYYNEISNAWVQVDGQSIYSVFKQTASGFEFTGLVSIAGDLITSGVITGIMLRTAQLNNERLELSGTGFKAYNSSDQLNGVVIDSGNFSRICFYTNGSLRGYIQNAAGVIGVVPANDASLVLGDINKDVKAYGDWDFNYANITNLGTDTVGTHNHGIASGTKLAVVDSVGTIVGYVEWSPSGSHSHYVEST